MKILFLIFLVLFFFQLVLAGQGECSYTDEEKPPTWMRILVLSSLFSLLLGATKYKVGQIIAVISFVFVFGFIVGILGLKNYRFFPEASFVKLFLIGCGIVIISVTTSSFLVWFLVASPLKKTAITPEGRAVEAIQEQESALSKEFSGKLVSLKNIKEISKKVDETKRELARLELEHRDDEVKRRQKRRTLIIDFTEYAKNTAEKSGNMTPKQKKQIYEFTDDALDELSTI